MHLKTLFSQADGEAAWLQLRTQVLTALDRENLPLGSASRVPNGRGTCSV